MNVMVDVSPAMPHQGTTLASCLCPLMQAVGRPEWSMARLQGVLGHAFQFDMKEGGLHVNHDHLDWGPALDILPRLAKFRVLDSNKNDTGVDLLALKQEARDAVWAGLKHGTPALVWSPMSQEMKKNHEFAVCWGLIVGYSEEEETFTFRHPFVDGTYTVRFDEFGFPDPNEPIRIRVYDGPSTANERTTHLTALRNAVAIAHATRYAADDERNANRRATPHGFAAYELWRKAFDSEDIPANTTHHHLEMLMWRRVAAATFSRELVTLFPEAAEQLEVAATHYDREMESLNPLHDLCDTACERQAWHAEDRSKAGKLIGDALESEREAIASIEAALATIDK